MTERILRELDPVQLAEDIAAVGNPVVFLAAPNFEDRSVAAAKWFRQGIAGRTEGIGVHVVWLQTPGVDDIFDRIKADNRDHVVASFGVPETQFVDTTRLDLPSTDTRIVIDKTRDLARRLNGNATLIVDISSLPRTIVRHLLDGIVTDQTAAALQGATTPLFSRVVCLYTAAGDYPVGADADMIGGIEGYYTKRGLHDLIRSAGVLEAFVSMAGTAHDAAQTFDALWSHGTSAKTSVSASIFLNRENFVYSYQRLGHETWALTTAKRNATELFYTFETRDVIRHIFRIADQAVNRHLKYRQQDGVGIPTFLLGGYGPKPIGLAALLARMRYERAMTEHGYPSTSDVLQVTGFQYTTRYSHGVGPMKAFEVDVNELFDFAAADA